MLHSVCVTEGTEFTASLCMVQGRMAHLQFWAGKNAVKIMKSHDTGSKSGPDWRSETYRRNIYFLEKKEEYLDVKKGLVVNLSQPITKQTNFNTLFAQEEGHNVEGINVTTEAEEADMWPISQQRHEDLKMLRGSTITFQLPHRGRPVPANVSSPKGIKWPNLVESGTYLSWASPNTQNRWELFFR